ncbi:MAG: transcriptional regulator [Sphingobium sp.]|nr:transcriptional regulator [Sphingobium sp.]
MGADRFQFGDFTLDAVDRRLLRAGHPVELGSRYFDALLLLLGEPGKLVSKDRFMDEIWQGVPVTDEALTQCIRTLRRQLGDDAARPRFIETVPKHGYRFVGAVRLLGRAPTPVPAASYNDWLPRLLFIGGAGIIGGGIAGILGGLLYGFGVNAQTMQPAMGSASVLFVLLAINLLVGLAGGAGVGFGLAISELALPQRWHWSMIGGAAGGFAIGAAAKLIGLDAFRLFLGHPPASMTGALEGALLGAAIGLATWLARHQTATLGRSMIRGGLAAGIAGLLVPVLGGRLLGGSLDLLLQQFPDAGFRLDSVGAMFGETGFGPVSQAVTAATEGALFGACLLGAIFLARQALDSKDRA